MTAKKHFVVHVIDNRSWESTNKSPHPPGLNVITVPINGSMSMSEVANAIIKKVRASGGGHHSIDVLKFFGHGSPGTMEFGTGLNFISAGQLQSLSVWMNPKGKGVELHGCHTAAAWSRQIRDTIPKHLRYSFSTEHLNHTTGFKTPRKGQPDLGKELLEILNQTFHVPIRGGIQSQHPDPARSLEGEIRQYPGKAQGQAITFGSGNSGGIKPDFIHYSTKDAFNQEKKFGFDLSGDGKPDVYVKLKKEGQRVGFDLDKNGKIDIYVSFIKEGNRYGFDLDGDKKADVFPPLISSFGKVGFDLNGDRRIDLSPSLIAIGQIYLGFDMDGDRKADITPPLIKVGGQLGFDLNDDNKIDIPAKLIRSSGKIGFDLTDDGQIDMLPPIVTFQGRKGYDTDGDGIPDVPLLQNTTFGALGHYGTGLYGDDVLNTREQPGNDIEPPDQPPPFGGADGNPFTPG